MSFLLGLFAGCVLGFMVTCLCRLLRQKTPKLYTASSSLEDIEREALYAGRVPVSSRRVSPIRVFQLPAIFPIKRCVERVLSRLGLVEKTNLDFQGKIRSCGDEN